MRLLVANIHDALAEGEENSQSLLTNGRLTLSQYGALRQGLIIL